MKRRSIGVLLFIVAFLPVRAGAQTAETTSGEPPELTDWIRKRPQLSSAQRRAVAELFPKDLKNVEELRASIKRIGEFLAENPDYSDGYALRATIKRCLLQDGDFDGALADLQLALTKFDAQLMAPRVFKVADHYAMMGKAKFDAGKYAEAVEDLDRAVKAKPDDAEGVFSTGGVDPEAPPETPCNWTMTDMNRMVAAMPKDHRPLVFRGLYLTSFTTATEEKHLARTRENFAQASLMSPRSALPHYFLGNAYSRAGFLGRLSGSAGVLSNRQAISEYTAAIRLDPKLQAALMSRANALSHDKQFKAALADYDAILDLNADYTSAYHDRAIAKTELGQYLSATWDYSEVIRRRHGDDDSLSPTFEARSDLYLKLGDDVAAIKDLSAAIYEDLRAQIVLIGIATFRQLYPEYGRWSDAAVTQKVLDVFSPPQDPDAFRGSFNGDGKTWKLPGLDRLYEKRAAAYLRVRDFKRASADFGRIYRALPDAAKYLDRWRFLTTDASGEDSFLDVKTADFPARGPVRLWIRSVKKDKSASIVSYEFDCSIRQLRSTSQVAYDAKGEVASSSDQPTPWKRAFPDSIGESWLFGACGSN